MTIKSILYSGFLLIHLGGQNALSQANKGQKVLVKLEILNSKVSEVKDASVFITIVSNYKGKIEYSTPLCIGTNKAFGGDIYFDVYKKDNKSKYLKKAFHTLIDYDPQERPKYFLAFKDSLKKTYNLNLLEFLTKGDYKFRAVFRIGYPKSEYFYSNWVLFKVKQDILPEEGSIIE
jgi:hypothetical protein